MFYVIAAVVISVTLLLIFKLFEKFSINTLHAIIINYCVAAVTGIVFSKNPISASSFLIADWIWVCLPLGFLFISVFYLISLTTQKINIATASVANKMSVVMPVLASIVFIGDKLSIIKISGIILALIAVYLTTFSSKNKTKSGLVWLPILVFVGSGLIDVGINLSTHYFLTSPQDSEIFSIGIFISAFFFGFLAITFQYIYNKKKIQSFKAKSIIGGIVLGIPNYFSIFFIIKAIETGILSSAQLFPILNISNVVLSALLGYLLFKDKLDKLNLLGILLAIVSIALIT